MGIIKLIKTYWNYGITGLVLQWCSCPKTLIGEFTQIKPNSPKHIIAQTIQLDMQQTQSIKQPKFQTVHQPSTPLYSLEYESHNAIQLWFNINNLNNEQNSWRWWNDDEFLECNWLKAV